MHKALFLFRRDLRLEDNTGLQFALENAKEVILAFIFTPEQIIDNPYRSDRCLQFMIESLEDLENQIKAKHGKLYLFFGETEKVVEACIKTLHVDAVVVNQDYTPYSQKRDLKIHSLCKKQGTAFYSFEDALLHPVNNTLKADGKPYTVFTPYYRNASRLDVQKPTKNSYTNYYSRPIAFAKDHAFYKEILPKRSGEQKGGRSKALEILKTIPTEKGSTHLSAHLKFTTCSPREVYHMLAKKLGADAELIRSLYWRDFFTSIAYHFPNVFQGAFKSKFDGILWNNNKKTFHLWCEGKTGFPIVDAGMRELNQTGFISNRVRMIVASFLIKDLHINWQWGEKYFAQMLIDCDPAINNGNWQWVASTGCDAQPYFRVFNPWTQAKKFDPDGTYIKRWVPELSLVSSKEIHTWNLAHHSSYIKPIVDHSIESKIALKAYKKALL